MATTVEDFAAASDLAAYRSLVSAWPGPAALFSRPDVVAVANAAGRKLLADSSVPCMALARGAFASGGSAAAGIDGGRIEANAMRVDAGVLLVARDATLAINLRAALAESRARYKDLVEISSDFAWETDVTGAFTFVSPRGALGYPADALVGRRAEALMLDPVEGEATPFAARAPIEGAELWLKRADGAPACVVISARPLAAGARGVWRDVTEERARDQALADARHRERLMAYVVRAIRDQVEPAKTLEAAVAAVCRALDADGAIIWRGTSDGMAVAARRGDAEVNDLAARDAAAMTGPHACDLAGGSALVEATRFAGRVNGALGVVRGGERPAWSGADRAFLGDLAAQLGIALAQIEGQETLSRLADTDMLTGLMNRRAFARALDQRLQLARREGRNGALAYIDLDNFKPINDRLGHPAGDAALRAVAELLRAQGRAGDLAARLGGDEFALWLDGAKRDGAKQRAERLLDSRAALAPVSVDAEHPLGMSIGMAMHDPKVPETADAMIARADAVMYAAKRAGKGRCRFAPAAKARKASA